MTPISVVLADDHQIMRASIRSILDGAADIKVIQEASNGLEALQLAQDLTPDVLLLDMEMPRLTGVQVAQRLQAEQSPVRILALSAHDDWQYIKGLLETGASGYLIKTEITGLIVEAVRGLAKGERGWISPQVARQMSNWRRSTNQSIQLPLTGKEKSVLRLVAQGKTNHEIKEFLGLSEKMVDSYLETTLAKLGVSSKAMAVKQATQAGMV